LINTNVKLLTTYVSQGSATTDLRGGGNFNSNFLHRYFLNLTVKNYENWSTVAEVIVKIKVVYFFWDTVYCRWLFNQFHDYVRW